MAGAIDLSYGRKKCVSCGKEFSDKEWVKAQEVGDVFFDKYWMTKRGEVATSNRKRWMHNC